MGQYCFASCRMSSVVVCNAAGGVRVGDRAADTAPWASTVTSR